MVVVVEEVCGGGEDGVMADGGGKGVQVGRRCGRAWGEHGHGCRGRAVAEETWVEEVKGKGSRSYGWVDGEEGQGERG